jgi:TPR repeat protein
MDRISGDRSRGVPESQAEAAKWFRLAAEQGLASAQDALGGAYYSGRGVPKNHAEAAKWFRLAAEQGLASAQFNLGGVYLKGQGVPKNYVQAYAWFNLAAAQGHKNALAFLDIIAQTFMTPAQVAEGQKLSRTLAQKIENRAKTDAPASPAQLVPSQGAPSRTLVAKVQVLLQALDYDPGPIDGIQGKRTNAAVKNFQRDLKLLPTGVISEELLMLLRGLAAKQ